MPATSLVIEEINDVFLGVVSPHEIVAAHQARKTERTLPKTFRHLDIPGSAQVPEPPLMTRSPRGCGRGSF